MPLSLSDSVLEIKGVGAKTAASLEKAGIKTIRDLLYYLPRTYENYQATTSLKDIRPGRVCVRGKITDLKVNYTSRRNLNLTEGVIYDKSDAIRAVWFNQPYRAKQFEPDKEYFFTGNYDYSHNRYQLTSPTARLASDVEKDEAKGSSFKPIYRSKGSFKSENFQKIFSSLRSEFANIPDLLPITEDTPDFVKPGVRSDSLYRVHFAENSDDVETGRHYLAYEELFELILAANLNREESSKLKSLPIPFDQKATKSLVSRLPFALTNAQRRASWEILQDLGRDLPMNRLLQGDVGSGKTVVAALAAHTVAHAGYQTASSPPPPFSPPSTPIRSTNFSLPLASASPSLSAQLKTSPNSKSASKTAKSISLSAPTPSSPTIPTSKTSLSVLSTSSIASASTSAKNS